MSVNSDSDDNSGDSDSGGSDRALPKMMSRLNNFTHSKGYEHDHYGCSESLDSKVEAAISKRLRENRRVYFEGECMLYKAVTIKKLQQK